MENERLVENFWIIKKSGILIFSKSFVEYKLEEEILAGFLSALDSVLMDSMEGTIKFINMKKKKFSYDFSIDKDLIFVINTRENTNNVIISRLLREIRDRFYELYCDEVKNFSGNSTQFEPFEQELLNLLQDKKLRITCTSCGKIILDDFIEDEEHNPFCCTSCHTLFKMKNQ